MRFALIGQNLPHEDGLIREAAMSDLFFNYDHPNYRASRTSEDLNHGPDTEAEVKAALRLDAEDFVNTLHLATGFILDPDELVADYFERE